MFQVGSRAAHQRGSALVLATVGVIAVLGTGAALITISTSSSRRQIREVDNMRAFYLAEAGLAEAFHAVRIGRSGQVARSDAPARFGDGLVWVDARETGAGQVVLDASALCASGRASLSLVVEPVEQAALGFFAVSDLVLEARLLVDGYDSGERSYAAEVHVWDELQRYATELAARASYAALHELLASEAEGTPAGFAELAGLDESELSALDAALPALRVAYSAGFLDEGAPVVEHAPAGGLLGTNGDVYFGAAGAGAPARVFGNVAAGPGGRVHGAAEGQIVGETSARLAPLVLPPVRVPGTPLAPAFRHTDALPRVVPPGDSGFESIVVAAEAELVVQGPATVVLGELVLEPGAYAPEADVHIGAGFEVHGSVVARTLELGDGTRLHFDLAASGALPEIVSWKIVELPASLRTRRGDPFEVLGIARADAVDIADGHELTGVQLSVEYVDAGGITHLYSGCEADFDWTCVARVVRVERDATRESAAPDGGEVLEPEDEPEVEPEADLGDVRASVAGLIATRAGATLRDALVGLAPLSGAELLALLDADAMNSQQTRAVLSTAPLPQAVLARLLSGPEPLTPSHMLQLLLDNSPLPVALVPAVVGAPASVLTPDQIDQVLAAQSP